MSFKCSVFGHKFGDPVVDREREEAGSEVVITIRETQTCSRCGEERIVSENKEVTTLETPADGPAGGTTDTGSGPGAGSTADAGTAAGAGAAEAPATDSQAGAAGESDATAAADTTDTTAADAGTTETEAEAGSDRGADGPAVGEATAEMDDATIIEESPEESIVDEAEPDDVPTPVEAGGGAGDAGGDAAEDDAVILDDESADEAHEGDRQPGEWPEEPDDEGPDWSPPTDVSSAAEADVADEQATEVEPTAEAVTVPEGSFHCPECGFTTEVESSSLRAGDFCPDCHTGTLVHDALDQ